MLAYHDVHNEWCYIYIYFYFFFDHSYCLEGIYGLNQEQKRTIDR